MLPPTWRITLDPGTRRIDDGRVLVGGAPLRLLRLSPAGAKAVDELADGAPIGTSHTRQQLARRLLDTGIALPRPTAASRTAREVTVVVPVYGDAPPLARVASAGAVVVVDDASPSPVVAAGARVIRHDDNRGPAAARNTGWRAATTELVAFLDADCDPTLGWLEALLAHFDDPEVAAVAPRITAPIEADLPRWVAAYESAHPTLDRGPHEGLVRPRGRVPFVPTAALVARRSALEAVGGFDEAMRVGEDVDLVWRLVDAGWQVRYEPSVIVHHAARSTLGAWLRQRFDYGTSAAALARRHGTKVAPLAVSPWTAASWALVGAGAPVAGVALAASTTAALAPKLRGLQRPWREALRLAGLGHLYGGRAVADAIRRPWWPLAAVAAMVSRRARRAVALCVATSAAADWRADRPPLGPLQWGLVRLLDDAAYGAGVWAGCGRARSFTALRPDLTSWPGRSAALDDQL